MHSLSRRKFLAGASLGAAGTVLAACAPKVVEKVVKETVVTEKVVKETVIVEGTPKVVEKVVTVVVEQPAQASDGAGEKTTIEMWMWETEPRWKQVQAEAGLDEEFPNVEFKWTALPYGDLHQKAMTSMAAGMAEGLPSIIRTGANYYRPFVNSGGLMDVTDAVLPYEDDVMPFAWANAFVEGKSYQVMDDTGVMMFGYRWDLFEEAGLPSDPDEVAELIASYDDLIIAGQALDKSVGAKLFNMTPDAGVFNNLMLQDSTGYFDAEGNLIFDSDYHVQVAEIVKRMWDADVASHFEQGPQYWQAVKDGGIATMFYPNWQDFVIIDAAPETKGKWRVTKLPAVKEGGRRATTANGCQLCIPSIKSDDEKRLALEIALYMKFTVKATVAHMTTFSGAYVSYIPGLEAMADVPSPVLDDQFIYRMYLDAAEEEDILPWYRASTAFYTNAEEAVGQAMFKVLKDGMDPEAALTEGAETVRAVQTAKGIK